MAQILTDREIQARILERKILPSDYLKRLELRKAKRGHSETELNVNGSAGSQFCIILRQSEKNALDFSLILAILPASSTTLFRLRRYNGKSHEHTNKLEHETFYGFHIHQATERYQAAGMDEESFAEPTDRYADLEGAIDCMISDCGFEMPPLPLI